MLQLPQILVFTETNLVYKTLFANALVQLFMSLVDTYQDMVSFLSS
jgi:hypothetical protein